jgi:uncharacterized protein YlzI (FlbEa/FlbD family)
MIWLTDAINKHKVAINPHYIVAVFRIPEGSEAADHVGKTGITLTNGSIIVEESELEVVGMMA